MKVAGSSAAAATKSQLVELKKLSLAIILRVVSNVYRTRATKKLERRERSFHEDIVRFLFSYANVVGLLAIFRSTSLTFESDRIVDPLPCFAIAREPRTRFRTIATGEIPLFARTAIPENP